MWTGGADCNARVLRGTGYHASLSELCHPNRGGHLGLFRMLDTMTGDTTYSDKTLPNYRPVLGAVMLIGLAEHAFDHLDEAVLRIADLQHRIKPVDTKSNHA